MPARNAGVIMAITMQLENVRLTIDDVAHLVRTGNFAILLPDSREKYNKTPRFSQGTSVIVPKNGRACAREPIRNFSLYFERQNCRALRKIPKLLSEFVYSRFLR